MFVVHAGSLESSLGTTVSYESFPYNFLRCACWELHLELPLLSLQPSQCLYPWQLSQNLTLCWPHLLPWHCISLAENAGPLGTKRVLTSADPVIALAAALCAAWPQPYPKPAATKILQLY